MPPIWKTTMSEYQSRYVEELEAELAEAKLEISKLRAIIALHVAVSESRRQMIESLIADLRQNNS